MRKNALERDDREEDVGSETAAIGAETVEIESPQRLGQMGG